MVFKDVGFDDGVHWAAFFAKAAEDALGQINVVACGATAAVSTLVRFDGDGHRRAHGFAQFASNATLFAVFVTTQSVQATKTG